MGDENFQIKVKVIDGRDFDLQVFPATTVQQLKATLATISGIPIERQRLIHQCNLAKDTDDMESLGMTANSVLHLVLNAPPARQNTTEGLSDEAIRAVLESTVSSSTAQRRQSVGSRREIDIADRQEAIRQNLIQIRGLCDMMTPNGFSFRQRVFEIGQWVDVCDTVDQWLEAQVIGVRETSEGPQVYVHYNGWPDRWDEWIENCSPRILPLHTKTYQALVSPMLCPNPTVPTDAESLQRQTTHDVLSFIQETCQAIDNAKSMLEQYYRLNQQVIEETKEIPEELEVMKRHIAPLLDRTGRLVSDMAHIVKPRQGEVMLMPTQRDLASLNPRGMQGTEIHIYNVNQSSSEDINRPAQV